VKLYAVSMRDYSVAFIEFFWADDDEHAMEQAVNAHPSSRHEAVAVVPYEVREPTMRERYRAGEDPPERPGEP
jgi:hypothetical protein